MNKRLFAATLCATVLASTVPSASAVNTVLASPTGNSIYVNGVQVNGAAYKINGNNYFKLRDIAAMVVGSTKQFEVSWNQAGKRIDLTTDTAYTTVGGELTVPSSQNKSAVLTSATVYKNGYPANYTGYNIDSNNYYKLRDLCRDMNIGIKFDAASKRVDILTNEAYTEDSTSTTTPSAAAITRWNRTMDEFNEEMIQCNWNHDKYLNIVKKYGTDITGKLNATTYDVIAALESMTGAPIDAVSMNDKPVNEFWAIQLRKAMGEDIQEDLEELKPIIVTDEQIRAYQQAVIDLVNEERTKRGLNALRTDSRVQEAAQIRAEELVTKYSHTRPTGEPCFTALTELDVVYGYAGENIAYGQSTPEEVMEAWMNSPGHRANILSDRYSIIGVGYTIDFRTPCWSQLFVSIANE